MEDSDIIKLDNLDRVRSITAGTARRVVATAALCWLAVAAVAAGLTYALYGPELVAVTTMCSGVFVVLGLFNVVHWVRHYKAIMRQLDELEHRINQGEIIYGSQVRFQSYRQ
ncbi:hypothetical protein [Sorangium atrum]|uniref:Uncharacterized protein n=1 Tax=Sorangium atrum TaxID=2995308 RepID=A0ABT5CD59_9BACT|nr:hypothetical protein [Sorangium aterium]MDC0683062.1 hypothetical protein [Sorangium aterium]